MNTSLTALITAFFTTYLINTAGYSENTVKSYRDTFVLLFLYVVLCQEKVQIKYNQFSLFM